VNGAETSVDERQPTRRPLRDRRWLDVTFLVGLAGVFLVNALVSVLQPDDFTGLVSKSAVGQSLHLSDARWLGLAIGINDTALGVLVLGAIWVERARTTVLAWTGVWLLAVTVIKVSALDAFGG
jgi:hypothetical protein